MDPEIKITLPLSVWRVITAHLETGRYCDVHEALYAIYVQGQPQIEAAEAQAAAARSVSGQSTQAIQPGQSPEVLKVLNAKLN